MYESWTDEELGHWCRLRAVEWFAWPAFVLQPVLPVLYFYWPWYFVLSGLVLVNLFWALSGIRYIWISPSAANFGAVFVKLKWPIIVVCAAYAGWQQKYFLSVLDFSTPIIINILSVSAHVVGSGVSSLYRIQLGFASAIGAVPLEPRIEPSVQTASKEPDSALAEFYGDPGNKARKELLDTLRAVPTPTKKP